MGLLAMTRTALFLLLSFHVLADEPELWLVELEHNDGLRLQFGNPPIFWSTQK